MTKTKALITVNGTYVPVLNAVKRYKGLKISIAGLRRSVKGVAPIIYKGKISVKQVFVLENGDVVTIRVYLKCD